MFVYGVLLYFFYTAQTHTDDYFYYFIGINAPDKNIFRKQGFNI